MEKKSFSKRLVDYFFCGHKELLFLGSVQTKESKVSTFIYSCKRCGKLIKSSYRLDFPDVHVSTTIVNGKIEFAFISKLASTLSKYDIENFHRHMIESNVQYSLEQFKQDLKYFESIIINYHKQNEDLLEKLTRSENIISALKKENEMLSSIADNKDNVIYNERQLSILEKNEMQLRNSGMIKEWLMSLLLNRKALIPRQAFKLFKTMLTALFGYENMRNKWEYNNKDIEGVEYVEFKAREKRRTNR